MKVYQQFEVTLSWKVCNEFNSPTLKPDMNLY